jgi:hypothetical protein
MNDVLAWSLFAASLAVGLPLSILVQRTTGRKGSPEGFWAVGYFAVLSLGVCGSVLYLVAPLHLSISGMAALAGVSAAFWSLVAQALFGRKQV